MVPTCHTPLPADATAVELLGVRYTHIKTRDGGDLHLTRFGAPYWEHLVPENWHAKEWFEFKRERLVGTGTVYRVPTRHIRDTSLHLVVKWSRVGEDVPVDTMTINKFVNADFNSPFEEFALLMELRAGEMGPPDIRVRTQFPLAIYVPSERLQLWQTGRSESKIAAKLAEHPGVEIDILRQYVLLYGWIKGMDLAEVAHEWNMEDGARERFFASATSLVMHEMELKGYRVVDMKPEHVIVRLRPNGSILRDRHGQIVYGLVDYELLERTPEYEAAVRGKHRQHYLQHMARRFDAAISKAMPVHLTRMNVLGVDYVFGHAESTGGWLWVVGKDPDLFNYFLPERWRRTPKQSLSNTGQVFYTRTKDNIHLVWRVSRVGDLPAPAAADDRGRRIMEHGFNSPFEEFALAMEMTRAGIETIYPRAIYMTGHGAGTPRTTADPRRFREFAHWHSPDGHPLLAEDHDYITVWGFWNGPDEMLAAQDGQYYRGVNVEQALREELISNETAAELVERARQRLQQCGFEDLNLKPDHLLISFTPDNELVKDTLGKPQLRLCNFELVCHIPTAS